MNNMSRRNLSKEIRYSAADLAAARVADVHINNGEELEFRGACGNSPSYMMSFTKGLAHNKNTGLLQNPLDYQLFVDGINSGDAQTLRSIPLGPAKITHKEGCPSISLATCESSSANDLWQSEFTKNIAATFTACKGEDSSTSDIRVRAWESQAAGNLFDLEGPDAQTHTMPPAPRLDSLELAFEMAEVYEQALLRDVHVAEFSNPATESDQVNGSMRRLNLLLGFVHEEGHKSEPKSVEPFYAKRQLNRLTNQSVFRGFAKGDTVGPYLSQFLLIGNGGINGNDCVRDISKGKISYGAIRINQKVRVASPKTDYMTSFPSWLDVQNGADLRGMETYIHGAPNSKKHDPNCGHRFICTPRDLATYVHYDQLYQAYLNACLILCNRSRGLRGLENCFPRKIESSGDFATLHMLSA